MQLSPNMENSTQTTPSSSSVFTPTFDSIPGIYIPFLFYTMDYRKLYKIFQELSIFTIEKIDLNRKTKENGQQYYHAFIHIKSWHQNSTAITFRSELQKNKDVKILYDDHDVFFICKRKHELHELSQEQAVIWQQTLRSQGPVSVA